MMQMFPLDVAKVDLVLHMLKWDLSAAAVYCSCWAHQHARGCGGVRAETVQVQINTEQVRDMEQHGIRCGHRTRSGAGPHVKQA
jgi:hypothetical protein